MKNSKNPNYLNLNAAYCNLFEMFIHHSIPHEILLGMNSSKLYQNLIGTTGVKRDQRCTLDNAKQTTMLMKGKQNVPLGGGNSLIVM